MRDAWPLLAKRLSAYLRRRGASWHDIDDIVQECAVRVLSREVPFTDVDDLLAWCLTVVRNAHVDLHRGHGRLAAEDVPDMPASVDVHEEVAARLRLDTVVAAWPQLSAADRLVLTEAAMGVPAPRGRREAVRLYVRRNRARQRLQALTAALVGVLAVLGRNARRHVLPLTTLTSTAAVTFLWLSPVPSQGSPAPPLVPDAPAGQAAVRSAHARPASPSGHVAGRRVAPQPPQRARGGARVLVAAQGPEGYGAELTSHERPASGGSLVCVGDLPLLADTCLADPTRGAGSALDGR